jgi:hypothetical protein
MYRTRHPISKETFKGSSGVMTKGLYLPAGIGYMY